MKKKFFTNLALRLTLNMLIKPIFVLGIDLAVQNKVGAEDYGFFFSLFNLSLILNILLDLGITNFNNKNIAQNNQLLSKHFSNILVIRFLLGVFYAVVVLAVGVFSNYSLRQFELLIWLIICQFLLQFISYLRSNISALQLFKIDTIISALDRALMIVICGVLLWTNIFNGEFQIEWFVYTQTFSYLITAIFATLIVIKSTEFVRPKFDYTFILIILKQSFPYALLMFLMGFYTRFDGYILELLLPKGGEQAGIYAQAFRLLDAASQFALLFAGLLLPMFAKMIKDKQPINELVQFSFLLLIIPSTIFVIGTIFYSNPIMNLLYNQHIDDAAQIFNYLIISFMGICSTYIYGTLLTANGNLKALNIMALAGVAINFSLNIILIPEYKAFGAAIATLVTQILTAIAQIIISVKIFKLKVSIKLIITYIIFLGALIALAYFSQFIFKRWIFGFFTFISLGFIFAFIFRLLNLKQFYRIIRFEKT